MACRGLAARAISWMRGVFSSTTAAGVAEASITARTATSSSTLNAFVTSSRSRLNTGWWLTLSRLLFQQLVSAHSRGAQFYRISRGNPYSAAQDVFFSLLSGAGWFKYLRNYIVLFDKPYLSFRDRSPCRYRGFSYARLLVVEENTPRIHEIARAARPLQATPVSAPAKSSGPARNGSTSNPCRLGYIAAAQYKASVDSEATRSAISLQGAVPYPRKIPVDELSTYLGDPRKPRHA